MWTWGALRTSLAPFLATFTFGLVGGDMDGHKQLFLTYIFLGLPWWLRW